MAPSVPLQAQGCSWPKVRAAAGLHSCRDLASSCLPQHLRERRAEHRCPFAHAPLRCRSLLGTIPLLSIGEPAHLSAFIAGTTSLPVPQHKLASTDASPGVWQPPTCPVSEFLIRAAPAWQLQAPPCLPAASAQEGKVCRSISCSTQPVPPHRAGSQSTITSSRQFYWLTL